MGLTTGEAKEVFSSDKWHVMDASYSPRGDAALVRAIRGKEGVAKGRVQLETRWYHCRLDGSAAPTALPGLTDNTSHVAVTWVPGPEPVVAYQTHSTEDGSAGMELRRLALDTGEATLVVDSAMPARFLSIGPTGIAVAKTPDRLILWPWGDWEARKLVNCSFESFSTLRPWHARWDGDRLLLVVEESGLRGRQIVVTVDGKTGELKEWEAPCEQVADAVWVPRP